MNVYLYFAAEDMLPFIFRDGYVVKVFGRVGLHFLQILSVWKTKPDTIITNHQLELSGTRVKYLDHEKRAYKHCLFCLFV